VFSSFSAYWVKVEVGKGIFEMVRWAQKNAQRWKRARLPTTSTNEMYSVEQIVDKLVINNSVFYCVKWVDYPETDNTWYES